MVKEITTFHMSKSTGVGGVENLLRNIYRSHLFKEYSFKELYFDDEIETYQHEHNVAYKKVGVSTKSGVVSKLLSRVKLFTFLLLTFNKKVDTYILFHPALLFFSLPKLLSKSQVILVQTNKFKIWFNPIGKISFYFLNRFIDKIVVYTDLDKARLVDLYPYTRKKINVIPRGCSLPIAKNIKKPNKKILTISRILEEQKNFDSMIEISKLLNEDLEIDIYGVGSELEVDKLCKKIENLNNINFKGEAKNIEAIISKYSCFIMTSHFEGFGQTLIEARSQGLPIVVFDTFDAAHWIVRDGINGYLVTPYETKTFASIVNNILSSPRNYEELSRNSIKLASETALSEVNQLWLNAIENEI